MAMGYYSVVRFDVRKWFEEEVFGFNGNARRVMDG